MELKVELDLSKGNNGDMVVVAVAVVVVVVVDSNKILDNFSFFSSSLARTS